MFENIEVFCCLYKSAMISTLDAETKNGTEAQRASVPFGIDILIIPEVKIPVAKLNVDSVTP